MVFFSGYGILKWTLKLCEMGTRMETPKKTLKVILRGLKGVTLGATKVDTKFRIKAYHFYFVLHTAI